MDEVLYYVLPTFLIVAGALLWFRRTRSVVDSRLRSFAERVKGKVEEAPWILYPRMVVEFCRAQIQISCMHGSRKGRGGSTFAWVGCAEYPESTLELKRVPGHFGHLEKLGYRHSKTGDAFFDECFWIRTDDLNTERELLDEDVRNALIALDAGLGVRVRLGKTLAYRDGRMVMDEEEPRLEVSILGLPPEIEDLERMLEATELIHERLPFIKRRRAVRKSA
jgi:hypothetical protein